MSISLAQNQQIQLISENGSKLKKICVGVNWGDVRLQKIFGGIKIQKRELELSAVLYDKNKTPINAVYAENLEMSGIKYSGNKHTEENDEIDRQVITINLSKVDKKVAYIGLIISGFPAVKLQYLPFVSMRLYEGTPTIVKEEFARFRVDNLDQFPGALCVVFGDFYRKNNEWEFHNIGIFTKDTKFTSLMQNVIQFL